MAGQVKQGAVVVTNTPGKRPPEVLINRNTQFRMTEDMRTRVLKMQEVEIRKLQYPIGFGDALRKLVTIGLEKWEKEQGAK